MAENLLNSIHKSRHESNAPKDQLNSVFKTSRTSSCSVCHSGPARYRCPACSAITCSCSCVKEHKLRTNCTGVRELVPAVQKQDMDDEMLQRDYRFLECVMSRLERSLRNPRVHHLNQDSYSYKKKNDQHRKKREEEENLIFRHKFSQPSIATDDLKQRFRALIPSYGNRGRARWLTEVTLNRADVPWALRKLRYEARERATQLSFMPRDMVRHSTNTSHFNLKQRAIIWRVRVEFPQANVYFEDTVHEDISVGCIVSQFLSCPLGELRGWVLSEPSDSGSECSLIPEQESVCSPCTCGEDPLKDHWSEDIEVAKTINNATSNSLCEANRNPESGHTKCRVLQKGSVSCGAQVMCKRTLSQSKSTAVSFAEDDVIKMTLNPECDSIDSNKPLALDITHATVTNEPRRLSEAQLNQMMMYQSVGVAQLSVLFKNEDFYDRRRYIELCLSDSLRESISGLRVIEHPIFTVFMKDHSFGLASVKEDECTGSQASANHVKSHKVSDEKLLKYFDAECSDQSMDE